MLDNPGTEEERSPLPRSSKAGESPDWYSTIQKNIKGVTEETTTGVHRLYQMQAKANCRSRHQRQ